VAGKGDSLLDGFFERLAGVHGGEEATDAGVTASVGVDDLLLGNGGDLDLHHLGLLSFTLADGDDDGLGSLSDNSDTVALGVGLLEVGHELGGSSTVFGLESLLLGEGGGLVLVAEDVIGVLNGIEDIVVVGEEEEGSSDVESHGLVVLGAVASDLSHGLNVGGDEEGGGVDDLGRSEVGHVLVEVRCGVLARGGKVGAETSSFPTMMQAQDPVGVSASTERMGFMSSFLQLSLMMVAYSSFPTQPK